MRTQIGMRHWTTTSNNALTGTSSPLARAGARVWHRYALSLILLLALSGTAWAQADSCPTGVSIGFQGSACATQDFSINFAGAVATGTGVCTNSAWSSTNKTYVKLKPNQTYQLTAGAEICSTHIAFDVPEEYFLEINGEEGTTIDKGESTKGSGDGIWNVVLRQKCACFGSGEVGSGKASLPDLGGVTWGVSLGNLSDGNPAQSISIREEMLSFSSYTPAALTYSAPPRTTEVDVVRSADGSLRQVKSAESLADVYVISGSEYDVRFYRLVDVGAKVNGIYTVSGQPFITWKVKNPNPSTTDRLQLSKIQVGLTETSEYTRDVAANSWSLSEGVGARLVTKTSIINPTTGERTVTTTVKDDLNRIASKAVRTYRMIGGEEMLIKEVLDPDGSALSTVHSYYENPAEAGRYRKIKSISNPDGSWVKYDYDSSGNQVLVLRPWKDLALASATESNSHAVKYYYTNFDGLKTSLFARTLDSMEEKVAGIIVRKTTFDRAAATVNNQPAITEIQTVYSSAASGEATSTTTYHTSASALLAGRVAFIDRADGRRDTFVYERGDYISNQDPALSQFTPGESGTALRVTVVHGTLTSSDGVALKTTKETTIRDERGNPVLQETYVYTGAGYIRVGWTASSFDDRGQLTQTLRHTNQLSTTLWDADRKVSETDESGVETTYSYDSLGRVRTQTKKGIAANSTFPAQPDIVTTFTYDAEGRKLSETIAAGSLSLTKSTEFDTAGRVKTETDQTGAANIFTYTNGGRTQTIYFPGGATQVIDKYLDSRIKSVAGTAVVASYTDYGVNTDGTQYQQEFIGSAGFSSPRWSKITTDWLGRAIRVEKPSFVTGGNLVLTSAYNNKGQIQAETIQAGTSKLQSDKLYEYDALGNQVRAGLDIDASGTLTTNSTDRISETDTVFSQNGSEWYRVSTTKNYLADNDATATIIGTQSERLTNFPVSGAEKTVSEITVTDVAGNQTMTSVVVDRAAKKGSTKTDTPDSNTDAISVTVNGLLQSSAPATPQSATTYTYDGLGRLTGINDPRTGTNTRTYSATTGQLISESLGAQITSYEYYSPTQANAGRLKSQTNAQGKKVYFNYSGRGELTQTWGEATYPLEYVYDNYGQKTEMHTFRDGSAWEANAWPTSTTGVIDVTRWVYQEATGLLQKKQDASAKQVAYSYDAVGRLVTRTWARLSAGGSPVMTTYSYHPNTGEMSGIDYSDTTPDVAFTYDRGGRQTGVTEAGGTRSLAYNSAGRLVTDEITGGTLDGVKLTVGYDNFLRRNSLQSSRNATALTNQTYAYDSTSRLEIVTSGSQTATYSYDPSRGLLNTTAFTGGTNISKTYDTLGRLASITTTPASGTAQGYTYTYNNLSQRTRATREDGSYWSYAYNDRGELISGKKYWADNTAVAGQQSEYLFDNVGNRRVAKAGGDAQGSNLRQASYTANSLNQYVQRSVPGAVDIIGTAETTATVTVNEQAAYRRGDYFHKELAFDNSTAPVSAQVKVVGVKSNAGANGEDAVSEQSGQVYVPKALEAYLYDADGNLISDGRWNYTWDAENRLVSMEAIAGVPVEARKRLEYGYDYTGRRIQKKVSVWSVVTNSYQLQSTTKFVYDGWNLVAELDGNNALVRSYIWGQDVSNSLQGAGGIGGLLLINEGGTTYQTGYDGSGNVAALVKASGGTVAAIYDYDPFGQVLRATGEYANRNPFRFSTKYTELETGLVYYGFRYYNPSTGRWLSKDPMGEDGGVNLYAFVGNNPVSNVDALGLYEIDVHYYLTYWLAMRSGCFTDEEAQHVAQNDQYVDEDPLTRPGLGRKGFLWILEPDEEQQQRNAKYHALHPGSHQPYLDNLWKEATRTSPQYYQAAYQKKDFQRYASAYRDLYTDLSGLGVYLHYFQDTYSHEGFASPTCGHGCSEGHYPDHTANNVPKAIRMAKDTYKKLREWGKRKGCECGSDELTPGELDVIERFSKAPGTSIPLLGSVLTSVDSEIFGYQVNGANLRRKIQILGVPDRLPWP